MIKSVLFDLSGTLVVPRDDWSAVRMQAAKLNHAYARKNGMRLSLKEFASREASHFERYAELEKKRGADISDAVKHRHLVQELLPELTARQKERVAANMNRTFWETANGNWALRDGARECLRDLRSMNITLAIVSNHSNYDALLKLLGRLKIGDYFKVVIASEKIGVRKPNRKIFQRCLSMMNVTARQAVFVGDSLENDVMGAKAVGMRSILIQDEVKPAVASPDFTIKELGEIPMIIANLNAR